MLKSKKEGKFFKELEHIFKTHLITFLSVGGEKFEFERSAPALSKTLPTFDFDNSKVSYRRLKIGSPFFWDTLYLI